MQIAIQQEIVRSDESRYDHRLHRVLLVCAGMNCYDVAGLFQHSPRTIQYWVQRFEQSGFLIFLKHLTGLQNGIPGLVMTIHTFGNYPEKSFQNLC
jgi:hypothetical protein